MTENVKELLQRCFPENCPTEEQIEEQLEAGDILVAPDTILPYLQTALLDEKVLEVELDGEGQVYFTRLKDDPPDLVEVVAENGSITLAEPDGYLEGDYLTEFSDLITLPLEPGMGNYHLRSSRSLILRMFTNNFGVEMCATLKELTKVRQLPVLRLNYPHVARIIRTAREYRAKVPDSFNFKVDIEHTDDWNMESAVADISFRGIALSLKKDQQAVFVPREKYRCKLIIDDELLAFVTGEVTHLSKVRKEDGIEYICGMQFDLDGRTTAAAIETVVASVQRAHLKSLAEKSAERGIDLIS